MKLTAYKIHLEDGTDYVTNMAAGVTLKMVEDYFLNKVISLDPDERICLKCIKVEKVA